LTLRPTRLGRSAQSFVGAGLVDAGTLPADLGCMPTRIVTYVHRYKRPPRKKKAVAPQVPAVVRSGRKREAAPAAILRRRRNASGCSSAQPC
jgi:hypothetical protein